MAQGRCFWSFWAPLALRASAVVLLLVSLGFLTYCSAKFGAHLVTGYVVVWKSPPFPNLSDVREHPDGHLDADDDRTECPSGTYRSGIQCPCVPGSWSRKIAIELSCGPTFVAATHGILKGWKQEFAKFVDPESRMVMHSLYKGPGFNRQDVLVHCRIRAAAGGQGKRAYG
ncbi:hypothetical protein C8A01DRAFT_39325 [Parachaetomium inaequale]|uniref:Uncharacterized protein n=1 Tax=Parachaetomium inaequale TaxID=2588326 RepID=A0AAN6P9J1_9PEZI|nr:hypothetical protein C8A01DRAFT_39325 [Parachaetomium inaequale]